MTHPELLTNTIPKPTGVPSKHMMKIVAAMVLFSVVLGLIFSSQQEPLKAADEFARVSASTLTPLERSRVDQNHQMIEDAFKASGLPSEMPIPMRFEGTVGPSLPGVNSSAAMQGLGDSYGVMRNALNSIKAEASASVLAPEGSRAASVAFNARAGVDSKMQALAPRELSLMQGLPQDLPQGLPPLGVLSSLNQSGLAQKKPLDTNNSVWAAQESEVMNSKMVVADFDDLKQNQKVRSGVDTERLGGGPSSVSPSIVNRGINSPNNQLQTIANTLRDLDRNASWVQSKEAVRSPNMAAPSTDGSNFFDALGSAMGSNSDKVTPVSARAQDLDFLKDARSNPSARSSLKPNRLESVYSVLEGTIIPAVLTRDIVSDLPGTITAQVSQTVYDSITLKTPLICKGAKLIGRYSNDVRTGQSRLLFAFTRLILLNGQSFNLTGFEGSDGLGQAGIGGEVDNHFLKIYGASLAIGALSDQVTKSQVVPQGAFASSSATGQIMVQTTREILQKGRETAPTITVARGSLINVEVRQDLVFHAQGVAACA